MRKSIDLVNQVATSADRAGRVDPAGDDVVEAIHAVMHLVRSRQYHASQGAAHELTHMDAKVLGFFARHPGATQSDLATHSKRDKGQLARLVGGLKERGLLQAQADEADRRSMRLTLTPAGRGVQQTLQRRRLRLSDVAVTGLSDVDRRRLLELLARVHQNLAAGD